MINHSRSFLTARTYFTSLLAGAALHAGTVLAQTDPAATVHFVRGDVTAIMSGQDDRQLEKSDDIYRQERVETAAQSRIQMRFTDGGLVSLMPNSVFAIEDYFYEEDSNDDSAVFGLLKGGLRTVTGAIGKVRHADYRLQTPVATLGIRGTQYTAVLHPVGTLRVHVGEGRVVLTNDHGTLEVSEGGNAVVTLDSAPRMSEQGPIDPSMIPDTTPENEMHGDRDDVLRDGILSDEHRDFMTLDGESVEELIVPDDDFIHDPDDDFISDPDDEFGVEYPDGIGDNFLYDTEMGYWYNPETGYIFDPETEDLYHSDGM